MERPLTTIVKLKLLAEEKALILVNLTLRTTGLTKLTRILEQRMLQMQETYLTKEVLFAT
jgi:hypothetical protein